MKQWFLSLIFACSVLTVSAQAKNNCSCLPIPAMKTYQGDARKKHFVGYSIDWSCTYKCKLDSRDSDSQAVMIKASYHEFHMFQENGLEGICEGMEYKPFYNPMVNQEVYAYTGTDTAFSPSDSKSQDLQKWSNDNYCE